MTPRAFALSCTVAALVTAATLIALAIVGAAATPDWRLW